MEKAQHGLDFFDSLKARKSVPFPYFRRIVLAFSTKGLYKNSTS